MLISRRRLLTGGAALLADAALSRSILAARALPFPEIEAAGSPGELGLAHGRAAAAAIKSNLAFYLRWLSAETRASPAALLALAASFGAPLRRHLPALLEEIDGIARGSGRTLAEILLLNARSDLIVLGRARPGADAGPGCTSLALSDGKQLALGQTWDWNADLRGGTVLLRLRPAGGPRLLTFTEAGMVGKIGFNEHRLGVCLNFLGHRSESPSDPPGVPLHCLLRAVLGCRTLEEAAKLIAWAPRSASANLLLAQPTADPQAVDLELTSGALARLTLRDGMLVHANHYKHPALAAGCSAEKSASTWNRDRVATALARSLRPSLPDPALRLQRILASRQGAPVAISRTAAAASTTMTLAGVVMDLGRDRLHLCAGPPHLSRFTARPGV